MSRPGCFICRRFAGMSATGGRRVRILDSRPVVVCVTCAGLLDSMARCRACTPAEAIREAPGFSPEAICQACEATQAMIDAAFARAETD